MAVLPERHTIRLDLFYDAGIQTPVPITKQRKIKDVLTPQQMVCLLACSHYALPQVRVS